MLKKILFLIPFAAILFLGTIAAGLNTLTYDEALHFSNAERYWQGKGDRINTNSTMPVNAVHVIPSIIEQKIAQATGTSIFQVAIQKSGFDTLGLDEVKIYAGRIINLLFSLLLAFLILKWTQELYGENAGLVSLWIYAFTPTFLALGPIANSDMAVSLFCTLTFYYFWKCFKQLTAFSLILLGISLGLAQVSKYHAILIPFGFALILIWRYLFKFKELLNVKRWFKFIGCTLLVGVIAAIVINSAFLWNQVGLRIDQVKLESKSLKKVQSLLGSVPVPIAYPFYQGLDHISQASEENTSHNPAYLFGKRSKEGFKGFYFAAFALKETIPFILFTIAMILCLFFSRARRATFLNDELFLLAPVIIFWIFCNFLTSMQTGIRYLMPSYPFMIILMGMLFQNPEIWKNIKLKLLILALLVWHIVSTLSYTPNYLSYFNELIGNRLNARLYLADGNLCWGQNGFWLKRYLKRHPEAQVDPMMPTAGLVVVDVNRLLGLADPPENFAWIRENYPPVDHISHAHLVFQIPNDEKLNELKKKYPTTASKS